MEDYSWKMIFARWIANFIFCFSIVVAVCCGMGIFFSLLECVWDIMILCMVLCPLGIATAVTIGSLK